jgi:hypothetical protein
MSAATEYGARAASSSWQCFVFFEYLLLINRLFTGSRRPQNRRDVALTRKEKPSMRIDVQGLGFPVTAALLDHTGRRRRFALTRTSHRIMRVMVRLGDAIAVSKLQN